MFVNTLVFRLRFRDGESFLAALEQVRAATLAGHDHQDLPFERLVEELAVERPEALARIEVDPLGGIDKKKAVEIAEAAGFAPELVDKVSDVFVKLYAVYKGEDATLVEVNPLVLTEEGDLVALAL